MRRLRLTRKEMNNLLKESNKRDEFKKNCPFKNDVCGSITPPSYCDKCYKEGKYNIKNGRSHDEFSYNSPMEMENSSYNKIVDEHNKQLARECEFGLKETCKYKDYWEKCAYCNKEFSR